ncbi:hypothetical protein PORY_000050, partial [Pneumocystis oryctolagi]
QTKDNYIKSTMSLFRIILYFMIFLLASGTIINHTNPLCTAINPKNNQYADLRDLQRTEKDGYWIARDEKNNRNFSINICAPLIVNTTFTDNMGSENVSAMYVEEDKVFSIGETSSKIYFQGEKLVLQYKNGSLCPGNTTFRKSTVISFICNPHMYKKPLIFFVADVNSCAYFFEWHTAYACTKTKNEHIIKHSVVFGIILSIAFFTKPLQQNLSTLPMTPIFKKLVENDKESMSIEFRQYKESFSYNDLIHCILTFKSSLQTIKQCKDLEQKRVAIFLEPGFMYATAIFGIWAAGGISVPICITHPISEIKYIVEDCQVEIIVTSLALEERLKNIVAHIKKHIHIHILSKPILIQQQKEIQSLLPFDLDRGALIIYTSGTTGLPKGVLTTHRNIFTQVISLIEAWKYSPKDRLLHVLPLHHIHGIINALVCPLYAGGTIEFLQKFSAKDVWFRFLDLNSPQISQFMAIPTIYSKLIDYYEKYGVGIDNVELKSRMKKIRLMISGSAELPISLRKKWYELTGQILLERYGMTETGMILSGGLDLEKRLEGSVGWELPYIKVRLVNTEDSIDEGEIWVSGDAVFKEYFNKPDATKNAFVYEKDGTRWFKTNDIATRTKNGAYILRGRQNIDIIKYSGYKISALEIQQKIHSLPYIREVAVLGIHDDVWTQKIAALVTLTSNKRELILSDLRSDLRNMLASYKLPTLLKILPNGIPKNHIGKVDKKKLVKEFDYGDIQKWPN